MISPMQDERQKYRHDLPLELAVGFVSLGRDQIDLVDENDRRGVLLRFLKSTAKVGLGVASHF